MKTILCLCGHTKASHKKEGCSCIYPQKCFCKKHVPPAGTIKKCSGERNYDGGPETRHYGEEEPKQMIECNHDLAEKETACADGACPICCGSCERYREEIKILHEAVEYSNKILDLLLTWIRLSRKLTVELSEEGDVNADSLKSKLLSCIEQGNNCIALNREALAATPETLK